MKIVTFNENYIRQQYFETIADVSTLISQYDVTWNAIAGVSYAMGTEIVRLELMQARVLEINYNTDVDTDVFTTFASLKAYIEQYVSTDSGKTALPIRYFSTEFEKDVSLGSETQGVRLYSIFVIGNGNEAGFIQLWSQDEVPVIKATYPISSGGNLPVNFGDGVDFTTGLTVTWSDLINTIHGEDVKYLFNIAYNLI